MNPFEILGIDRSATLAEAKKAYIRLSKRYHPDVCKEPGAEDKMRDIAEAWSMLKDGTWRPNLTCKHKTLFTFYETEK